MPTGPIILSFKIPLAPGDDPRLRIHRALIAALRVVDDTAPDTGVPLDGSLRDKDGLAAVYSVEMLER
jgi:hypothetical protein